MKTHVLLLKRKIHYFTKAKSKYFSDLNIGKQVYYFHVKNQDSLINLSCSRAGFGYGFNAVPGAGRGNRYNPITRGGQKAGFSPTARGGGGWGGGGFSQNGVAGSGFGDDSIPWN